MIQDSSTISWNKAGKGLCDIAETDIGHYQIILKHSIRLVLG